jgi:hypothetical protein
MELEFLLGEFLKQIFRFEIKKLMFTTFKCLEFLHFDLKLKIIKLYCV